MNSTELNEKINPWDDDQLLWIGFDTATEDEFFLNKNILNRHMAVLGATGSGKTVLCKSIVEEAIIRKIPILAVDPQGDISRLGIAEDPLQLHKKQIPEERANSYYANCDIAIFTPGSDDGIKIIMDPMTSFPSQYTTELSPMELDSLLGNISTNITSLLSGVSASREPYVQFVLFKCLKHLYENGVPVKSLKKLYILLDSIESELEFSDKHEKEFSRMKTELNMLIEGPTSILFKEGTPLDIETLLAPKRGKTPLNIFYLNTLPSKELRQFFMSYLTNEIYAYMLKTGNVDALLYIDEVKLYLPPGNVQTPAKRTLLALLEQGRKYGLKILLATQSPGKIDYQALSQTTTRAFGLLTVKQDLAKLKDLLDRSDLDQLPSLKTGHFLLTSPNLNQAITIQSRWLYTDHGKPLASDVFHSLISAETLNFYRQTVREAFKEEPELEDDVESELMEEKQIRLAEQDLNIVRKETDSTEDVKEMETLPITNNDFSDILSIQRLLIIHKKSGICIYDEDLGMIKKEAQLISGFFTAITSMMRELKRVQKIKGRMEFREVLHESGEEGFIIWLAEGDYSVAALLLDRRPSYKLQKRLKKFVSRFEQEYSDYLEEFLGDIQPFRPVKGMAECYLGISLLYPIQVDETSTQDLTDDEQRIYEFVKRKYETLTDVEDLYVEEIVEEGIRAVATLSYVNFLRAFLQLVNKGIITPEDEQAELHIEIESKEPKQAPSLQKVTTESTPRPAPESVPISKESSSEVELVEAAQDSSQWNEILEMYNSMKVPDLPQKLLIDILARELVFDEQFRAKADSENIMEFTTQEKLAKILNQFLAEKFELLKIKQNVFDGPILLFGNKQVSERLQVTISKQHDGKSGFVIIMHS